MNPWVGKIPWRRKWQPTPVFLPGKSHGPRSLVGYCPWGHKESDTTERLHFLLYLSNFHEALVGPHINSCEVKLPRRKQRKNFGIHSVISPLKSERLKIKLETNSFRTVGLGLQPRFLGFFPGGTISMKQGSHFLILHSPGLTFSQIDGLNTGVQTTKNIHIKSFLFHKHHLR